jgi:hypothetical protein
VQIGQPQAANWQGKVDAHLNYFVLAAPVTYGDLWAAAVVIGRYAHSSGLFHSDTLAALIHSRIAVAQ